jgi:hypothetical protein
VYEVEPFPRPSWRRRLRVLLLAVATASTILLFILVRQASFLRPPPPDAARCAAGQTSGCVGGMASVIVAPAPAASAPR